jgi:hypothetical protein
MFSIMLFSCTLAGGKKKASTSGMMVEAISQKIDEGLVFHTDDEYWIVMEIISLPVKPFMSGAGHSAGSILVPRMGYKVFRQASARL